MISIVIVLRLKFNWWRKVLFHKLFQLLLFFLFINNNLSGNHCNKYYSRFAKDSVYFHGVGGVDKKEYEVTIPLYKEIDPDKSKSFNRERCIEIILFKVCFAICLVSLQVIKLYKYEGKC